MPDFLSLRTSAPAEPVEATHDRPQDGRPSSAAAVEPLLVPAPEAARLCGISEATWFRLKSAGKTPEPVKLGGRVLYRIEDLKLWVALGCPDRKTFDTRKDTENTIGRPRQAGR
jgi:predicted DNA-binding transcriptional regulator AlpA